MKPPLCKLGLMPCKVKVLQLLLGKVRMQGPRLTAMRVLAALAVPKRRAANRRHPRCLDRPRSPGPRPWSRTLPGLRLPVRHPVLPEAKASMLLCQLTSFLTMNFG